MRTNIAEDIKHLLEFYYSLGFERLPIEIRGIKNSGSIQNRAYHLRYTRSEDAEIKKSALDTFKKEIGNCSRCRLSEGRTHIVFGEGNPNARLMFIGEAPGREEDLQGRPFVGEAGMLLTRLIDKMGYKRDDVYIANIIKCRPPSNRDPAKDEIEQCKGFLDKQIEIIKPDIIMTLGRISAQTLLGNEKAKITVIRGHFFSYKGFPVMPTFHPAYLMRNPKDKWLTWSDAQKVMDKLKNEVS